MTTNYLKQVLCLALAVICLASCKKGFHGEMPEGTERGELVGFWHNAHLDSATVAGICCDTPDSLLKCGTECYCIEYATLWKDELVRARALVLIPFDKKDPDLVMRRALYCHGTNVPFGISSKIHIFSDYAGPNTGRDYEEIYHCAMPLAAAGYCVIMPDYTGFGPTKDHEHPFVYCPELCKCIIDALYAAEELFDAKDVIFNDTGALGSGRKLYICGWSQGGIAALATEKYLEHPDFKDVTYPSYYPSAPIYNLLKYDVQVTTTLAGPLSILTFINKIFNQRYSYKITEALYTWAGYVINYFDPEMQRPGDQIFNLPIYDQSQALMVAGGTPMEVFRSRFIDGVCDSTDTPFLNALKRTSYDSGWKPRAKVHIFYGTEDMIVLPDCSKEAVKNLQKEGMVLGENLFEYAYKGKGHFDFVAEYMNKTINAFNQEQ